MKKRLFAMLLSALLLANASACAYLPKNDMETTMDSTSADTESSNTENDQTITDKGGDSDSLQTAVYTTQELVEALQLSNSISMVLKNEAKVCVSKDNSLVYLNEYTNGSMPYADVSAFDLDENGANEVVVMEGLDNVIVLKEYEGVVYAWQYGHTALYHLRTDGTYYWNRQAGQIYGSSKLHFEGITRNDVELDRVEHNEKFFINETEVSQEEYLSYAQNQKTAEKAEQYCWKTNLKTPDYLINGK